MWYGIRAEWMKFLVLELSRFSSEGGMEDHFVWEVELDNTDKILVIETAEDVKKFTDAYYVGKQYNHIDWPRVQKMYHGIEVRNFGEIKGSVGHRLFDLPMWFCTWDLDSGCIWNPAAIKYTRNIKTLKNASIEWDPELKEINKIVYHDEDLEDEKYFGFRGARMK
jgi:hypothetical protein